MMGPTRKLSLLAVLHAAIWLAAGCVRLSEPDNFICNSDADCESGQRCPEQGRSCVPENFCNNEIQCLPGRHCVGESCEMNECSYSTQASVCAGAVCSSGFCLRDCSFARHCADGFRCDAGKCVPGAAFELGEACNDSAQCLSDVCCKKPSGALCTRNCPAVPDDSCLSGEDCLSNLCCKGPGGKLACSAVPCAEVPECSSDEDCEFNNVCVDQKCTVPRQAGEPCKIDTECLSESCVAGVCRGTAGEYDDCKVDSDCEARRICCKITGEFGEPNSYCGALDRGCPGSVGDFCELDFECIDNDCKGNFSGFCSKPCASSADCGVSPWGAPNVCETNGLGDKICFPGCTSTQQCWDNLDSTFECYDALDTSGKICAVD